MDIINMKYKKLKTNFERQQEMIKEANGKIYLMVGMNEKAGNYTRKWKDVNGSNVEVE